MVTWAVLVFLLNTRKVNNMREQIKAGDYVYIPTYSRKALLVKDSKVITSRETTNLEVWIENKGIVIYLDSMGLSSVNHIESIAFLATPENKARIEQFYGCELEDVPKRKIDIPFHYKPLKWR